MEKGEIKKEETKPCPLCGTMLSYDRWLKVVGVYEEQQKHRKQLELELSKTKEQEAKLKKEYQKIRQKEKEIRTQYTLEKSKLKQQFKIQQEKLQEKFEKEKRRALNQVRKEGIKIGSEKEKIRAERLKTILEKLKRERVDTEMKLKQKFQQEQEKIKKKLERQKQIELKRVLHRGITAGIEKQKARTEKVSQMAEKYRKARDKAIEKAKELEEMIKKGTTPQIEGFNFEHEFADQLKQKFPGDEIKPTGHKGDVIHTVQAEEKKVGKIIYECKKTKEFDNKFIEQIQRDKARVIADYGVIVTWATKESKQNFWVEKDIIVVHPYGALDLAMFLRETLLQMYTLKLSKAEFETKGKAILEFMQSEEFRTRIQNSIAKSREAYEALKKEITTHFNAWNKRAKIYESIYRNTNIIQSTVQYVLLHGKIPKNLPEAKNLPPLQISPRNEQNGQGEQNERKD